MLKGRQYFFKGQIKCMLYIERNGSATPSPAKKKYKENKTKTKQILKKQHLQTYYSSKLYTYSNSFNFKRLAFDIFRIRKLNGNRHTFLERLFYKSLYI